MALLSDTWRRRTSAWLDGEHPWGALVASPSRYGASQQRLIVYPPGITKQERRWLRAWRGWPLWGAFAWLCLQVLLIRVMDPFAATVTAVAVAVGAGVVAFVMAGDARHRVRTLHACVFATEVDKGELTGQRILQFLTTTLVSADAQHRRGELSTVEYEWIWWQVYEAMKPDSDTFATPHG